MDPTKSRAENLQLFLLNLLKPVLGKALSPKYFDQEAMKIWLRAFTSESVSLEENYEELEFFGDQILGATFAKYLLKRLPGLSKGQYTELKNLYMSKNYQGQLARNLGFTPFIVKANQASNISIEEDVFEAFFGAFEIISDRVLPGLGFINCYNLIIRLFQGVDIFNEERAKGGAKTIVEQIFTRFKLPALREVVQDNNVTKFTAITPGKVLEYTMANEGTLPPGGILARVESGKKQSFKDAAEETVQMLIDLGYLNLQVTEVTPQHPGVDFTVMLRPDHEQFLLQNGIRLRSPVLAQVNDLTKTKAKTKAYERALETLRQMGVTVEWAAQKKMQSEFSSEAMKQYLPAAEARLQREGLTEMRFHTIRSSTTYQGNTVQLLGKSKDGKEKILLSELVPFNDTQGKVKLLRAYAQGKTQGK